MRKKAPPVTGAFPVLGVTREEEARIRAAGYAPVIRWVDVKTRDDKPLKSIEVLTMLDRRDDAKRKKESH